MSTPPDSVVADVLALVERGPARLAGGRLLCIDGPAGSGKSTLADAVAAARPATLVCLDDLLEGWAGSLQDTVDALVRDVLAPLTEGRPAAYHRYDWTAGSFAEWVSVGPTELLVVEGVASGSVAATDYASALVWVEAAPDLRRERGLARDGDVFAPHWRRWAAKEAEHFAREHTRARADLRVTT